MMKRAAAWIMVILMMFQTLPVEATDAASDWYQVVSDELENPVFHAVHFTAEGEEVSIVYVADGAQIDHVPEAPSVSGKRFIGWYIQNTALDINMTISGDVDITAVYTTVDQSLEYKKQHADFYFEDTGAYAQISIFGYCKKNQKPNAQKNNSVTGATILEAWTVGNIKNKTDLTVEAVIIAVPTEGELSAYKVLDGAVDDIAGENLVPGDRISFDLSMKGAKGIALITGRADYEDEQLVENGAIYANEDLYITGKVPGNGIIDISPVTVSIDGQDAIIAYDIKIYANENQRRRGKTWKPAGKKVQVHLRQDAFDSGLYDVYHLKDVNAEPEFIDTVQAKEDWIQFDAEDFSVYAVKETTLNQTITTSDGSTYDIQVTYQNTAGIPMTGTELLVSEILEGDEQYNTFIEKTLEKIDAVPESLEFARVFDIRITDEKDHSIIYEPQDEVDVSIRLLGTSMDECNEIDVLHFVKRRSDYAVFDMENTANGETVQFSTDSFSVYVVIGTTYLRTYRFFAFNEFGEYEEYALYTDSGRTTFTQTIKNGEKPVAPQSPTNPQDPNATFAGWFEDIREAGSEVPVLAEEAYDFENIPEIKQNEEVHLYAKFSSYAYVIFHDQYDTETGTFPVAYTVRQELINGSASVKIADYSVTYHGSGNGMVFTGWSEMPITTPGATNNDLDEAVEKLDDTITVTGNKELYPIFTPVYWITFYSGYSGSGATYYPETYYLNGEGPDNLANYRPTRNVGENGAYTFMGWYAGATLEGEEGKEEASSSGAVQISDNKGILVSDFTDTSNLGISVRNGRIVLTQNVTLYAIWSTNGTAKYSIVIWKQKASDSAGLPDDDKSYNLAECVTETGEIGNTVSVDNIYQTRDYSGFNYSRCDSSKTIASDGSTVLNVYYDRVDLSQTPMGTFALQFYDSVTGVNTSTSLPIKYDQENGKFAKISYGTSLSDKVPATPVSGQEGYSFTYWYADQNCTVRVFFDQDAYLQYTGTKVLYATMPDQDVTVYAGWEETKYRVNIDPNYGALYTYDGNHKLVGTGATFFTGTYTSIIQEYKTVTRDYVESASGTWYYVKHDRAFYDAGNTVAGEDRYTYYTQDPGEATEFNTFAYEPGVYRYAGWYEVYKYGEADEHESKTPYVFGNPVDHDTTLRLHWTKVGTFYLEYDPGIGTLNDNEDQETFYVDLDGDTYADNAEVLITRVATPPDGYEFTGWTIRGDESGTVYYPGRSFTLLTQYAATVQGKKIVYLDAVYTKVPTASIVYNANGGTITEADLDYGRPYDSTASEPVYTYDVSAGTATISNLVNNSRVYLSDGRGFSRTDATFAGWSNKQVYDPDDADAILYLPGEQTTETYNVDTEEPFTLYAVWQVSVKYHLNNGEDTNATFGGAWGTVYTLNGDIYSQNAYINTAVSKPSTDPTTTTSGTIFRFWATRTGEEGSYSYTQYDFSQLVTGELDLYACWDRPLTVTVHAVDASEETLAEETGTDGWTVNTPLAVSAELIDLTFSAPSDSVAVPSNYMYAFAAVYSHTGNMQNLTESDAVASVYYCSEDGKVHTVDQNGIDEALADGDELYFVYYQQQILYINYRTMADDGSLTAATVNSSAPFDTVIELGQYDMAASCSSPLAWLDDSDYSHYAFAIGSASAENAKDLTLITSTSDTDSTRPALLVRNTWRGFQYSIDDGSAWISCGYEPALYVVYFANQAAVVTFTENTVGLAEDMDTAFTFNYKIETVDLSTNNVTGTVYNTEDTGNSPVLLRNGEAYSVILFTDSATTQRVTIEQTAQNGFTTSVSENGTTSATPYSFTADGTGTAQDVTFTNTRDTAANVEVHVALVDVANGNITLDDEKRSTEESNYSFDLALGVQAKFEECLPHASLFIGDSDTYAFGAVLYGIDSNNDVSVSGLNAVSIACELAEAGNENIYGVYLKDENGKRLTELGGYTLYYLYYPMPVIRYMEESNAGALNDIQGSTDGSTLSDTITYNGQAITLNGKTVTQNQKLEIPQSGLVISQSVDRAYFNMPPILDRGTDKLYLVYSRIGAGEPEKTTVSDISVSDGLTLYLKIRTNKLEWSFDGSTWTAFTQTPTIYAIYQERGYTLEITKTVPIDTGFTDPFNVTISSTAINRTSYAVEGTGSNTVSATPAIDSTPGTITVQVTDGSVIRIFGLGSGTYTVSESGNENHLLTVTEKYTDGGSTVTESLSVTDNSSVTTNLDQEKTLALTNTAKVICKVGTRYFHTIQSAVQWIEDNSATFSGTIEMLVDYLMPASDAPVIPYYLDVTLTTASEYSGSTATITRSGNFASGVMFTNSGTLSFENINLDGNGSNVIAASAMINNEGTLTVGTDTAIENAKSSGNGGVINTWDGSVTVSGGTIRNNIATSGGAIYATGGEVTISGGTICNNSATSGGAIYYSGNNGGVTISGGSISSNSAENGGAVYLEKGNLTVSGGSMGANAASENGGAVYAENGAIEISGGTLGGSETGNSAKNGGAVYLENGSVTVSGNTKISNNTVSQNGGGICTSTGTVTMSGGSLASNTAAGNGGGAYTASGAITVSGNNTAISDNSAANGGGLYSASGAISVTNATLSSNSATSGSGGGVYAGSGSASLSSAEFTGNSADNGYGGGVYGNSGAITLTSCTFGGASGSGNSAVNGGAVYTNTGSATFSAGTVNYNTATNGGAVGVGSSSARLYFSGNVKVTDNTMSGNRSNLYLDQDSDAVINAGAGNTGLGNNASIGVYVPDKTVTVTDITGQTSSENLFDRRGVPGAFFATYTNINYVTKFTNDRLPGLSVQTQTTSKRLYWGKAFTVEVRYLASLSGSLSTVAAGDLKKVDNNDSITYYAPSSSNAASEIADDLRSAHTISQLSGTAVFALAFVDDDRTFANYITDVNWDSANNRWSFVKRDGTAITGNKLVVYFSEPAYIQIENNTEYPLTISELKVLGQSAMNSDTATGYGYVFAVNGVIQDELKPITAADLILQPGKNIKFLFPGGKNAAWTLNGIFSGASADIPYTLNGTPYTLTSANAELNGTTLNTNGGTYRIIFGGKSAICRIVTTAKDGVTEDEIAGKTDPDIENGNKVEYTFSNLNQAVRFAQKYLSNTASIEMLVDYLIPDSDVVTLPASSNYTFTTAIGGTYKYSDDTSARATISRDQGNLKSFITSVNGELVSGDYNTSLKVENLIFDGKDFGGTGIERGIIRTKACNVVISNANFRNCQAQFGGGIYIESVNKDSSNKTPYGSLKVTGCTFTNCQSLRDLDKYGGGAIWTSMKNVTIENSQFNACYCVRQGGAIFHYIGGNYESSTTVSGCSFEGCSAGQAAGSMESGAKMVRITNTTFRNSTSNAKNGGALNVWALDNEKPTAECHVYLDGCTFEHCYANNGSGTNGNGGAMRSTATHNTINNCTFIDANGNDGGAINIYSTKSVRTEIFNSTFRDCTARNQGGAVFCRSKELIINGDSSIIQNCTADKDGGGICHIRDEKGSVLTINNAVVDNCSSSTAAGGGIYSMAQTVTADGLMVTDCTAKIQGGGIYLYPKNNSGACTVTLTDAVVRDCIAPGSGGGIYYDKSSGTLTMNVTDSGTSQVSGNTSGGMGGGIYTNAANVTLTGTTVSENKATGNGGGVCQNYNNANGRLTLDSCTVSGNHSGGKGAGTYTLAQMTIRNDTRITGNELDTNIVTDAAGVYLQNERILTVGTANSDPDYTDASTVIGNLTLSGNPSNLRLSQGNSLTSNNSTNSIDVLCHLSGEFRVIDAFSKGTQFGVSEISSADSPVYTKGFSDINHVFVADDDSLYGIIDRSDTSLRKIIWASEPICKITDANRRLLYLDTMHEYPAVFDKLDTGDANNISSVSAFSILRNEQPKLYYADGTLYTGSTYQVRMLVENYTATKYISTNYYEGRNIILTSAGSADSQYPYRGRSGTRSTITRGTAMGNYNFITANVNLTLTNIVLDGGSESGVTTNSNTRIISSSQNGVTITLGRNSALQNASVSGNNSGGAVYLSNASLFIEGGAIRNCSAKNGGAVYKDGENGTVTMTGGSITRCTATNNGGGIYIQKGPTATNGSAFTMTGGSITRCTANNGGGVWINNTYKMSMSGGSISQNSASTAGGGIAVGGKNARLNFSGAPFVYGNTVSGSANNVYMNQTWSPVATNNPGTIIHTTGLIRGATIGVYVPGVDNGAAAQTSLYDKHGAEMDPFGTYEGTPAGFNYFINDRNGLKGGLKEGQEVGIDMKIYWRQIYTLEVNLEVLSRVETDKEKDFHFTVTLNGNAGGTAAGIQWNEVNETYGDMEFHAGVANFTLNGSTNTTAMADLLPLGYGYTVTLDFADATGYVVYPGFTQTGAMNDPSQFLYTVNFRVVRDVVCKITDKTYGLLYYKKGEAYVEAVYDALVSAFNRVNMGELYYKVGDSYIPYASNNHRIEMLIPEYEMKQPTALNAAKTVLLTTADPNADDGFPYAGGNSTAVIKRDYDGDSMITVNGNLALGDIILDGNSGSLKTASANGGIVNVSSDAILTIGTGATLQNSTTSGSGAAVYLAQGATMKISGSPVFSNNISTGVSLGTDQKNGGDAYSQARQDIYIVGYGNDSATSLVVTGDLTGSEGSIWVWPEKADHYVYGTQFAVMQGGAYTGLNVFRDARTDADSKNACLTSPAYLYGVSHGGDTTNVYWNAAWLTLTKEIAGDFADMADQFAFTVSGLTSGQGYRYTRYTSTDGATWTSATGTDVSGNLTSDTDRELKFNLGHHQKIVISIPSGTPVTITEKNGQYKARYSIDGAADVSGTGASTTTTGIAMDHDITVAFTNTLNAVSPTGVNIRIVPYTLMLSMGIVLLLSVMLSGRRRRKNRG